MSSDEISCCEDGEAVDDTDPVVSWYLSKPGSDLPLGSCNVQNIYITFLSYLS